MSLNLMSVLLFLMFLLERSVQLEDINLNEIPSVTTERLDDEPSVATEKRIHFSSLVTRQT